MATPTTPIADLRALHDALPLSDPDRHDLEDPALETAFAHLAPGYPTPPTGGDPMTTYTTRDGHDWDLTADHTVNSFHYRWDGAAWSEKTGPLMVGVCRPGLTVRLEWLAVAATFDDAEVCEHRPHPGGNPDACPTCRDYNGHNPLPALPAPALVDTVEMRIVEVA